MGWVDESGQKLPPVIQVLNQSYCLGAEQENCFGTRIEKPFWQFSELNSMPKKIQQDQLTRVMLCNIRLNGGNFQLTIQGPRSYSQSL